MSGGRDVAVSGDRYSILFPSNLRSEPDPPIMCNTSTYVADMIFEIHDKYIF